MIFATYEEFQQLARSDRYYSAPRWELYSKVQGLIAQANPTSVLELGAYRLPLVKGCDTMDRFDKFHPTYVHDAGLTPWPIAKQQYEMFIALQVWEHLKGRQQIAFSEVRRIAKRAILSFPYRWNCPQTNPSHHGITEETIAEWTAGFPPVKVEIVPSHNNHRRIIYQYDFEAAATVRDQILKKEQSRTLFCPDPPATLRREPDECPHRIEVRVQGDRSIARCQFLEQLFAIHGFLEEIEVREDACRACVQEAEPTLRCLNSVTSSLIVSTIVELSPSQQGTSSLQRLRTQAEQGLRFLKQGKQKSIREDSREFGDCAYYQPPSDASREDFSAACDHPAHALATREICHLCEDHRSQHYDASQSLNVRLPMARQGSPVQRWMVGVTTSPREVSTLNSTLDSLLRAGWSSPWIFMDGGVEIAERHQHLPVTFRETRCGAWPNYYLSLTEMLMRDPRADAYLLVQDDVLLTQSENLKSYLESVLWPAEGVGAVSLYCSAKYHREQPGWHDLQEKWVWGALAFVFSNTSAWAFVSDPEVIAHRQSSHFDGTRQIDVTIGEWVQRTGKTIRYPVPSLAQHLGESSTLWKSATADGKRQVAAFIE